MATIYGRGRPTSHTKGDIGQLYVDQNSYGKLYKCVDDDEYSDIHGAPVGGYRWEEIPVTYENGTADIVFMPMMLSYVSSIPFDQFHYMFGKDVYDAQFTTTPAVGNKSMVVCKKAVDIRRIRDRTDGTTVYQFTFLKDDGSMQTFEFKPDETVTEVK